MASLMENLIEVLGQEGDEYEGLLALSQLKGAMPYMSGLALWEENFSQEREI